MINLTLVRSYLGPSYTIGHLYIDDKYFCDTLEDVDRGLTSKMSTQEILKVKIKHETAIPVGMYYVDMNTISPKYSNFAKYPYAKPYNGKMPRILNIPGYDGVLIHPGNNKNHTSGCILVGENKVKGQVINSQATWKKLMEILTKKKDVIVLTIKYKDK